MDAKGRPGGTPGSRVDDSTRPRRVRPRWRAKAVTGCSLPSSVGSTDTKRLTRGRFSPGTTSRRYSAGSNRSTYSPLASVSVSDARSGGSSRPGTTSTGSTTSRTPGAGELLSGWSSLPRTTRRLTHTTSGSTVSSRSTTAEDRVSPEAEAAGGTTTNSSGASVALGRERNSKRPSASVVATALWKLPPPPTRPWSDTVAATTGRPSRATTRPDTRTGAPKSPSSSGPGSGTPGLTGKVCCGRSAAAFKAVTRKSTVEALAASGGRASVNAPVPGWTDTRCDSGRSSVSSASTARSAPGGAPPERVTVPCTGSTLAAEGSSHSRDRASPGNTVPGVVRGGTSGSA